MSSVPKPLPRIQVFESYVTRGDPNLNCSIRSFGSVGSHACNRKPTREVNAPLPLPLPVPEHFAQIAEVVEPPFTTLLFSR